MSDDVGASSRADARVQVALTFDFDTISPWLQTTTTSPSFISRGEFGRIGVERVQRILTDHSIKGTFFTPGHTALCYPDAMEALVTDGHEIGHHGWVHEPLSGLTEAEERRVIERGLDALETTTGRRPAGFRAPGWDLSTRTVDLLLEYGFSYESSMMGNDYSPYWCRSGDVLSATEPFQFGRQTDLVELPVAWHLDDVTYFEYVPNSRTNLTGLRRPADALEIWQDEFTYLYEEVGEGCLTLTMHPQSIGRGHRIGILGEFIEFVLRHDGATFLTAGEIVDAWRRRQGPHSR